ncbi:MAG: bifunctional tRNA (5-methylaminomethyl-2-thiouridine)(34)-methyltransferase MnmD/FAD-dependent 5-carboxymethylaminomethyl-2-thiouridine(34) oxidoreductase MnmC [Gammaproteobacteria bacterium]|nr:MAG: bifunctional tRNA (5-methylaminomethyl-2-thiouridine)(34)-methyltransferase MnmD/FAD-dependent 5-carboxymethylaminomethyl-2-thiouridine(34) oxidoreductase MnmC [Gammaproteobacteria bacterium]
MAKLTNNENSVIFTDQGVPFSTHFEDIYFDSETGYQQSQQVFIEGNQLSDKLLVSSLSTHQKTLTIAETGFGTGLNFLLTLRTYHLLATALKQQSEVNKQLLNINFISIEKYPLTKAQLMQALTLFPELKPYTQLLLAQYPHEPTTKQQLNFFNNKVTLTLVFDDATQALTKLHPAPKHIRHNRSPSQPFFYMPLVDIWYLDGFSPEKNPQMWSRDLFTQIARLSKPQATFATFTVAGFVQRGLSEVGFRVQKQASTGQKKEILTGIYQTAPYGKGYQQRAKNTKPQQVTIIGGGIASACAAYALTKQGIKVQLYCKDADIAQGASSNAIGALFPLIHQLPDNISRFYQQAFWRAKQVYQEIDQQGFKYNHNWCGLLDLAFDDKRKDFQQKFEQLQCWPKNLLYSVNNKTASHIANLPLKDGGLFFPQAGWVAPQELVQQLFNAAKQTGKLKIKCNVSVKSITQSTHVKEKHSWKLNTNKGKLNATVLLLCGGAEAIKLKVMEKSSLVAIRGQVSSMQPNEQSKKLKTVICHQGYLTPQHNNQHCIGATFQRGTFNITAKEEDDIYNLNMLKQSMPNLIEWQLNDVLSSKARLRCTSPDHFPMVGAMPDIEQHKSVYAHLAKDKNFNVHTPAPYLENLYVLTGLGARGLCSAPLLADILVADLCGTPYPVDYQTLYNLAPNRFIIKDIVRHKL